MQDASYRERIKDPAFGRAVDLLDAGDESGLRDHLKAHPKLVAKHVHYEGNYFTQPTLLHFAAENPIRNGTLPANILAMLEVMLDSGAEVDASSHPDRRETVLALIASGMIPRQCGKQVAMLELLIARGADPDCGLGAALGHAEKEAARTLLKHGAMYGLVAAASLGDLAGVERFFAASDAEERQRALALAAHNGEASCVVVLLTHGVDANVYNPQGAHHHATPLHNAVAAGHIEVVKAMLEHGVRTDIRDRLFNGTPHEWATHCNHPEIAALFEGL